MHLSEVLALRAVPAAGLIVEVTRRCPLSCAHCSTESTMESAEGSTAMALRLVASFRADDRPDVVALTGGEPLLRPRFVVELTERAHLAGARVHLLTGMFFARRPRVSPAIRRALALVDHVSASLDVFHEREVPRQQVFRVLGDLIAGRKQVSLQIVGTDSGDEYVERLVADVRRTFSDRVPVLVSGLRAEGRAKTWLPRAAEEPPADVSAQPAPCTMAAWPVVRTDGAVTACCNQAVVDGRAPPHLVLGHALVDSWPDIRARCQQSTTIRAIRTLGPRYLATAAGTSNCSGYCETCHRLADEPDLPKRVAAAFRPQTLGVMDAVVADSQRAAGAVRFAERFGMSRYAQLVTLGREPDTCASA
jgi:pyruvate-formate lyase-activating enzyme